MITDEELVATGETWFRLFNSWQPFRDDERDDIRQEIYMALLKARRKFDPAKSRWRDYSMAVVRFAIADFYRDSPRIGVVWSRLREEATYVNPLEDWDEPVPEQHDYLDLKEWLDPMSTRERTVSLLLLAGYTQREIGGFLSISEHRVYRTLVDLHIKNSPLSFGHRTGSHLQRQAA